MNFFVTRGVVLVAFGTVVLAPDVAPAQQYPSQPIAALDKIGAEPASGGTEDLARAIKDEQERVAKAVAAAGIKPQ